MTHDNVPEVVVASDQILTGCWWILHESLGFAHRYESNLPPLDLNLILDMPDCIDVSKN